MIFPMFFFTSFSSFLWVFVFILCTKPVFIYYLYMKQNRQSTMFSNTQRNAIHKLNVCIKYIIYSKCSSLVSSLMRFSFFLFFFEFCCFDIFLFSFIIFNRPTNLRKRWVCLNYADAVHPMNSVSPKIFKITFSISTAMPILCKKLFLCRCQYLNGLPVLIVD